MAATARGAVPPRDPADVEDLPVLLRELRGAVGPIAGEEAPPAARAVLERLDRDLLPRTAGGSSHLVVGIVGPNNAGKSALFNALVGAEVSPSRATGGATRRLVGAAHPRLLERLESEPSLTRFPLRRVPAGRGGLELALEASEDAAELVLVPTGELEDGVLLVDAPDFDSIHANNRRAAEALLRVTDLALVVVTQNTYQNREVVDFLVDWLAHGRPWLCVYNEALGDATTAEHVAKLARDVGAPPVATFAAPHDTEVAEGRAPLRPRALPGAPATDPAPAGTPLDAWLLDLSRAHELKGAALAASLGQLHDEIVRARDEARADREAARALEDRLRVHAQRLGRAVAGAAVPMGPFLEAFRSVLDRRPNLLQRGLRGGLRRGRIVVEGLARRLRGTTTRLGSPDPDTQVVELERRALEPAWPPFFEAVAADTAGTEVAAELTPEQLAPAGRRARESLAADPEALRAFRVACEELIEAEMEARGNEWLLQVAVDAVHLLPAVAAGVVIVQTGGLGADVAVGGAGALSSLLAERVSRLLGTRVAWRARQRWTELRGARVADLALEAALPEGFPRLEARRRAAADRTATLERLLEALP